MAGGPRTFRATALPWLLALLLLPSAPGCGGRRPLSDRVLTIATATPGGTYYPVGRQLAAALERLPEKPLCGAWAWITAGSPHNVRLLENPRRTDGERPENLEATDETSADLALVNAGTLDLFHSQNPDSLEHMRALAALQLDIVHLLVRDDPAIRTVQDLANARVYMGMDQSGTRWVARQVLSGVPDCEPEGRDLDFAQAAAALVDGRLDAAVIVAGTPVSSVATAMKHGFKLLPLSLEDVEGGVFDMATIAPGIYQGQPGEVRTVSTWSILCARRDLEDDLVELVLDTLHQEIDSLLLSHAKTQHIRLDEAYLRIPTDILPLHPAAARFWAEEQGKLCIATGNITGLYYRFGKALAHLLAQRGIATRALHTDGSSQNLALLEKERPTLALLQYDVALAARWNDMKGVYGFEEEREDAQQQVKRTASQLKGMRRIARLHEEKVHVLIRNEQHTEPGADVVASRTLDALKYKRISVGPPHGGSRLVAKAILKSAGLLDSVTLYPLSMPDTIESLRAEALDGAIFVCAEPSLTLRPVLSGCEFRLLSIDGGSMAHLIGRAFTGATITKEAYLCLEDGQPVQTLSTRAVLVCNGRLTKDRAEQITTAIVEGLDYLPGRLERKDLAEDLPSIPLHAGAKAAYEEAGLLPPKARPEWLSWWVTVIWKTLAIIIILLGAHQGMLKFRRDATANRFGREVNRISTDATVPHSVERLRALQKRIRERVIMRWWQPGEINRARWLPLNELIEARIVEARENLARGVIGDIRALKSVEDVAERRERAGAMRDLVWTHVDAGELDRAQALRLLDVLGEIVPAD